MKFMMCGANGRECVQKEGEVTLTSCNRAPSRSVCRRRGSRGSVTQRLRGVRVDICAYVHRFSYALVQELVSVCVFCFVRERERKGPKPRCAPEDRGGI